MGKCAWLTLEHDEYHDGDAKPVLPRGFYAACVPYPCTE